MFKKVLKIVGPALGMGSGVILTTEPNADLVNDPKFAEAITFVVTALVTALITWMRSPKDDPKS